jgi:hypothetical protein
MTIVGARSIATLLVATMAVAGACGVWTLSREQAVTIAVQESELRNPVLFNAYKGNASMSVRPREAWIVSVKGEHLSCEGPGIEGTPESLPCQFVPGMAVVYVDLHTGEVVGWEFRGGE